MKKSYPHTLIPSYPYTLSADILVIGSGIAGLLFAHKASRMARVVVATKKEIFEASTNYAQGGLAAVLDPKDSFAAHRDDTLRCGDWLCDKKIVEKVVEAAPAIVEELAQLGVPWSETAQGRFDLGLEGGHSKRRIAHAKDFTGKALEKTLADRVRANPHIQVLENTFALDLILESDPKKLANPTQNRVLGARFLTENGALDIYAPFVVLATGGAGKVYLYTTNPEIAAGDGMAMSYRAGCPLSNLEFVQFHPTCLYHPMLRNFLISEAVRGEGAILKNLQGQAFMKAYDRRGELAPRDIVARAIDDQMKKTGAEHLWLDISHRDEAFLKKRFPNIFKKLLSVGINMAKDPIPIVPAAHYFCGGVVVGDAGRTAIPGLYAIGEVACTGLHGANRLASNSLLEACAFAHWAAQDIEANKANEANEANKAGFFVPTKWGKENLEGTDASILVAHSWDEVRRIMANYVGIVRSRERLDRALKRLLLIEPEIQALVKNLAPTRDIAELANITLLARLIVESALWRRESRGLHWMLDYPRKSKKFEKASLVNRGRSQLNN